jgi:phospholipase/lecithinase/hemolysin
MQKELVTAGFILFSLMLPLKATAASFSKIYTFGDSLSDTGNAFKATASQLPPSPPYFEGRFSNGPVWIEYLAKSLGLRQTNFAIGGANTDSSNTLIPSNPLDLPGLEQQIKNFTTANPTADKDGLYVVWGGANDYLGGGVTDPTQPVTNLANAVTSLANVGAKNIMVVNLPDLGKLPGTSGDSQTSTGLSTLTGFHNSGLNTTLAALSQQPGINIIPIDVNSLFNRAIATKEEFGFTNVTDACLDLAAQTICPNQNQYLFWDAIHPTTRAHSFIAETALAAVGNKSIPEPSAVLGMLAFGVLGAAKVRQRKLTSAERVVGAEPSRMR